jgi:hypothetical protein
MRQLLATLCVTSSLALVTLGGSNSAFGFRLRTMSFNRPPAIRGPVGDTTSVSHVVVAGAMCEE